MNKFKITIYAFLAALLLPFSSCKDESLNPVPDWDTAVNAFGQFTDNSPSAFFWKDMNSGINATLRWISVDQLNTVERMELFVTFSENYIDPDGNPRVANHGTKNFLVIDGSNVPGNREDVPFSLTPTQVYDLFKDATFDYGKGEVKVFENPDKDRPADARLIPDDVFQVTWAFTTADGRYFDSWSDSVCSEFPGSNCNLRIGVVCPSDIGGTFDYVSTNFVRGDGGSCSETGATGTVTWSVSGDGRYTTSDASFGLFATCYGDDPATGPSVLDTCERLSTSGSDQYGDTYTYSIVEINGPVMTLNWSNTYGDAGTVVLTRQDGNDWPPLYN